ncbi:MAG: MFS transporter, partial [Gemmatimonadaceae bacterium]
MNVSSRRIQSVYLLLLTLHTLAASLIWGINTLFLLDAGLSNTEAFAANAFFTAGMVIFEVPTGVVADTRGRRTSYLLGTLTLGVSTLLYLLMWRIAAPFWAWALTSAFLGLGFTFFSGAVQAWLVDALTDAGHFREGGTLETVLAKGEIAEGAAMLIGSVAGGVIAQATNLGVPYMIRALVLGLTFVFAFLLMRDLGFTPSHGKHPLQEVKTVLRESIKHGLGNPPVRWVMLEAPFTGGVIIYAFYAMQPYLL